VTTKTETAEDAEFAENKFILSAGSAVNREQED